MTGYHARRRKAMYFLAILLAAIALHAGALDAGAAAPPHVQRELAQARLAGQGSFRWLGLKIYDARLWVGAEGYRAEAAAVTQYALDLRYARSLSGLKIAEASQQQMHKLGLGSAAQRARWQEKMEKIFPDVIDGTHLTGVHLPGQGARFYHDGKLLGEIADVQFAAAFFAIWLDPATTAATLRNALLANAAPR